ncbi:MAG: YeiH family protein [Verrucomicrobiota bacterium]
MKSPTTQPPWYRNEDWLSAAVGLVLLAALLVGWRPALPGLKWKAAGDLLGHFTAANVGRLLLLSGVALGASVAALGAGGVTLKRFVPGFAVVATLAWIAQFLAGFHRAEALGLEYVIFALALGLLVRNLGGAPEWLREAARSEFYIKTGVVLLGATILLPELLKAGALGLLQALLVVSAVWAFAVWLARRLRVDDEFAVMLAAAVSICGVSAAIAACGAIQGDRKKLSYITSLVLIVAVPMMVAMPWLVKGFGLPDIVGGAWLGGTLDTSGSVAAAGLLISEPAMKAGVVVKFSQNVLIGFAALFLAGWWAARHPSPGETQTRLATIWERFPKFVLGFLLASAVFSFVVAPATSSALKGTLTALRNLWFALAFVSIGLETRFRDLWGIDNGRPALAFLGAQAFNVVWTLLLAWLIFGGLIFPVPTLK